MHGIETTRVILAGKIGRPASANHITQARLLKMPCQLRTVEPAICYHHRSSLPLKHGPQQREKPLLQRVLALEHLPTLVPRKNHRQTPPTDRHRTHQHLVPPHIHPIHQHEQLPASRLRRNPINAHRASATSTRTFPRKRSTRFILCFANALPLIERPMSAK